MSTGFRFFLTVTIFTALLLSQRDPRAAAEEMGELRIDAAAKLDAALRDSESLSDPERQIADLKSAAAETRKAMSANVLVEDTLHKVEQSKSTDPRALAKEWRNALTVARDILRFEPLLEAPLPEGFPKPTPLGEIRVQRYPKYRLARTDMTLIEGRAFLTLFNHIQQRDIAMTAPVEMTYSADGENAPKKSAMSFLYRSTEQGQLGNEGKVEVVDVPAHLALSMGIRGDATKERLADARRRLESWLQTHGDEYEPAGSLRVMGYNSPFVSDQKRLTEVQIPVSSKRRESAIAR